MQSGAITAGTSQNRQMQGRTQGRTGRTAVGCANIRRHPHPRSARASGFRTGFRIGFLTGFRTGHPTIFLTSPGTRPLVQRRDRRTIPFSCLFSAIPPIRIVPDPVPPPTHPVGKPIPPTPVLSDWADLMRHAQNGNKRAYESLLREVTRVLRPIVRRALSNPADVEDVVQDILVTLHQVASTYDPARPFGPWLSAIARRRVIDWLRRSGNRRIFETGFDPGTEDIPDQSRDGRADSDDLVPLMAAIRSLPDGQRQAVELLKLQELSLKEASAKTGLSVSALKVATHRAYKTLRAILERTET